MKAYEKTQDGITTQIPLAEGLQEINHAMMEGKRFVETMSASRTDADITYKNGIRVVLRQVEIEEPADCEEWTGTYSRFNRLHRFDRETLRARCNARIRPRRDPDGYAFQTRASVEAGSNSHLYTFCPACEKK